MIPGASARRDIPAQQTSRRLFRSCLYSSSALPMAQALARNHTTHVNSNFCASLQFVQILQFLHLLHGGFPSLSSITFPLRWRPPFATLKVSSDCTCSVPASARHARSEASGNEWTTAEPWAHAIAESGISNFDFGPSTRAPPACFGCRSKECCAVAACVFACHSSASDQDADPERISEGPLVQPEISGRVTHHRLRISLKVHSYATAILQIL